MHYHRTELQTDTNDPETAPIYRFKILYLNGVLVFFFNLLYFSIP